MRVLFTAWAWPSHLYAMVPLARALQAAGHEVLVASQPALLPTITATGLLGVAVGHEVDTVGMVRGCLLPSATATDRPDGNPPSTSRGPRALGLLLAHAASMVDDLVTVARRWAPDAVVFEPTALAGPIAAATVGVPAIRHLYGVDLLVRAREVVSQLLAPLAEKHGVADVRPEGAVTIDPCPPRLRLPDTVTRWPVRYAPYNGPGDPAPHLPRRRDAVRVCVTWGHTIARLDPHRFMAGDVARALAGTGIEVVLAVSADQRDLLGLLPTDVAVVEDVPLHTLLPQCDLTVAHGGAGTTLTSLHAGLPLLLVPQLPDHAAHAARVLAAGAVLTRDEATAERLRAEVSGLLDRGAADAARQLRDEMAAQPPMGALVAKVEALAGGWPWSMGPTAVGRSVGRSRTKA